MTTKRSWYFWATDTDRSWGWSNHVYTMGVAFQGFGDTAELAKAEAQAALRDDYKLYCAGQEPFRDGEPMEDSLTAIPEDAEVSVSLTIPVDLMND